ncbi:MAG: DUF3857 domain-containing protein [Bacteroidota bacterium]
MKRFNFSLLLLLLITQLAWSQKKTKFGDIDRADLAMTEYAADTSAKAVILYDDGYTDLDYIKGRGFAVNFTRHVRIKVLKKSGLDYADFSILLYQNTKEREKVVKFKAITHSLKNGKAVATKVSKKELFNENLSENRSVAKVAMPQVEVGSIIEIEYSVVSPFYWNLWDWQYQYEIPVRHSEYQINYPEWFDYNIKFKGYDLEYVTALDLNSDSRSIFFGAADKVSYQRMKSGWVAENMPAFVEEAYISTKRNFLVAVTFELASTKFPGSMYKSYITSWEEMGQSMMESDGFGKQLAKGKTKFLAAAIDQATAGATTPEAKIAAVYQLINQKVAWNEHNGKFTRQPLKEAYYKGRGSVAEINLLLIGALRRADIDADPVLISTKEHGFLNPGFPAMSQFNYVLAKVNLPDGKYLLLDASNNSLPMNLLSPKCINDKGLVVKKEGINWIELRPSGKFTVIHSFDLTMNEDMAWTGNMKSRCKDYGASYMRQTYEAKADQATYIATMESENDGLVVSNYTVDGLKKVGQSIKESCEVSFDNQIMDGGDLLYFNPMLTYGKTENPFKLPKRTYPVNFPYPQSIVYSFQYKIPEGYEIDELPEKKVIALPEKGGTFSYSARVQNGKIMVISQFKINKNRFLPNEYLQLKEFYNIVIAKHAEQVVLRKV